MSENLPETIADRYRVLSRLGAGGIGVVYQAFDPVLDKNVAVKVLLHASDDLKLRFHQEAKAAGKLKHQNIISVLDFGLTKEQQPYMVMECVEGTTLAQRVKGSDGLSLSEACGIVVQICDGLEHAHNNGVLHRDIKPGNIMLREISGEEPQVIIVDFGLAKFWSAEKSMTASGEMMGSPYYISPEQVTGGELDARTDIYSLGCVMFDLLTGRPPFLKGLSAQETMSKHVNEPPPSLSSIGSDRFAPVLEAIVAKCLEKSKDDRFKSIDALRTEVLNFCAAIDTEVGDSSQAPASEVVESKTATQGQPNKRNVVLAVVALLAVGTLLVINIFGRESQDSLSSFKDVVKRDDKIRAEDQDAFLKPFSKLGEEYAAGGRDQKTQTLHRMAVGGDEKSYRRKVIDAALENPYAARVELSSALRLTNEDEAKLISMQNLAVLGWHHSQHVSDSVFRGLSGSTKLRDVNLEQSKISDSILESIGKMKALERLALNAASGFTNKGLSNLVKNERLISLDLAGTEPLDNEGLKYISQMSGLSTLNIDRTNKYDSKGFAQLAKLKKLRCLLMTVYQLSDQQIKQRYATVASIKSLESISIRNPDFDNIGILSSLPRLRDISVRSADFTGSIEPILSLKIVGLNIFGGVIDQKTTRALAGSNLEVVTFQGCEFAPGAIDELKNAKHLMGLEFIHCEGDIDAMKKLRLILKGCTVKVEDWDF